MYDSLTIEANKEHLPNAKFLEEIPQHLDRVSNAGSNDFGEYVNGFLGSLKIGITENRVKVEGSLPKYYLGDNFKTLSRGDTRRALEKISDSIHLPLQKGNVHRIDIAHNIILKHPESLYYNYLGEGKHYSRLSQNNGIYYQNGLRQLLFYGKVHEQSIKGEPIPELYRGRNVLRIELRYKRRLDRQFNVPMVTADMLYDEAFYKRLLWNWRNEYLNIQKLKNAKIEAMELTGSKKEFLENLALLTIMDVGQPRVLAKIKEAQETGRISKKQAYDLRSTVKELAGIPARESNNDLINELDEKVKQVARVY